MTSAPAPEDSPDDSPAAAAAAAIYDPDNVPESSLAYRETPVPHRLSVPDYAGEKVCRLRRRLIGFALLAAGPLTLFSARPWAAQEQVSRALVLAGAVLLGLGLLLRLYARMHLAAATAGGLVQAGPYAMLRHPLYFGAWLAGAGLALLTAAPVCWAAYLIFGCGLYLGSIVFEERRLTVDFPGVVNEYRARVAMLGPTRLRWEAPPRRLPLPALLREALVAAAFLALAAGIELLVHAAARWQLPVILRLW